MLKHGLAPIIGLHPRALILGTLPGDASLAREQYYAHPRNHFWPIMQALLDVAIYDCYSDKCRKLMARRIAVWDVLGSAERHGSLDQAIKNPIRNDVAELLDAHRTITSIIFNGKTAQTLFGRHIGKVPHRIIALPSTSPANVTTLEDKTAAWRNGFQRAGLLPASR